MNALADMKILKILDNQDILLNDGVRGELLIGNIHLSHDELLKRNIVFNDFMSLCEFKKAITEDIVLSCPEKFVQSMLSKITPYTIERGWQQEYTIQVSDEKDCRLDMAKIINDTVLMFNECKHAEKNDFSQVLKDTFATQVLRYCQMASKSQKNHVIIGNIFVYDGNYIFNNPQILGNLGGYISDNTSFFKSLPFYYENNTLYEGEQKSVTDIIPISEYIYNKTLDEICVVFKPESVYGINTLSNPRDCEQGKVVELMLLMADDIIDDILRFEQNKNKKIYNATDYTTEKQIQVKNKPYVFSDLNQKYLYGFGLSLSNGQHSVTAYAILLNMICNINSQYYNNPLYKIISQKTNEIRDLLNSKNDKMLLNFCNEFYLKAKITIAYTKDKEKSLSSASNKTVGMVDTTLPLLEIPIKIINDTCYKNGINDNERILQINCPHSQLMDNCDIIDYNILGLIPELKKSTLSKYRNGGFKKDGAETILNNFYISRSNRTILSQLKKEREKILLERNNAEAELKENDGYNDFTKNLLKKSLSKSIEELLKINKKIDSIQSYSEDNINQTYIKECIDDLTNLNIVYNNIIKMGIKDNSHFHKTKMAFSFMEVFYQKNPTKDKYKNMFLLKKAINISDCLCGNKIDINKNSIFNETPNKYIENYVYSLLKNNDEYNENALISEVVKIHNQIMIEKGKK